MEITKKNGLENVVFEGKIIEVVQQPVKIGDKKKVFEMARRSPGVRLIIVENNKILLTKEYRVEIDNFDYRLPGGKVFDTLEEYKNNLSKDIIPFALEAAKKEAMEETGLIVNNIEYFTIANAGATVKWDLIYFVVDEFEKTQTGQKLELGENIEVEWKNIDEIKELIKNNQMKEYRSVGVLFEYFLKNGLI